MRKFLTGLIAILLFSTTTNAQVVKQAPTKATTATTPTKTTAAKVGVVLKKDGTPDKRYNNAATAVPLKKDGTPDKRFKGNKKS